ncbi:MAG: hypothetical protein IJ498_02445 [Akkermansia sp.]|nr:hypothetical protein [Akkermansia sp.]
MKKLLYLITLILMVVTAPAMALQLDEITPTLTRTQADQTLSKDYSFTVLDDFTVRRTWVISGNRRVSVDFNPQNDQLLMVMLEYGSGVDPQKAAADVRQITGAGKTKWKKMDKKKAEKYNVPVNSHNAKSGSCYAFMEMNKAKKCKKVMIYRTLPDSNRSLLGEADTASGGETALGNRAGASVGKVIAEQEAKRLRTPLASSSSSSATSTPKPGRRTTVVRKPVVSSSSVGKTAESSSDATAPELTATESDEEIIEDEFEEIKVESRFNLSAIQASVGLQGVSPAMLIGGAVAIVILLTLIGMMRGSGERKKLSRYRNRRY